MSYESVDALQCALTKNVFYYAKDAKKAAGRALGTVVEIITFYLLKSWGLEKHLAIERRLPEYANPDITHNVEFSLHPSIHIATVRLLAHSLPITPRKIATAIGQQEWLAERIKSTQLLSTDQTLRNACILYEDPAQLVIAHVVEAQENGFTISVNRLVPHPFAVVECKRVGVEEGVGKGPQTIEKAKQGAYVAGSLSSLQKMRMADGTLHGILELASGELCSHPYQEFLQTILASNDPRMLRAFTVTVGVVSNHGNWFTSDDHNKELKVLAQSYDWLLFLTDAGLSDFVEPLLLKPAKAYESIRDTFLASYAGTRGANRFTKVRIALAADLPLRHYFSRNLHRVEGWFNVISPAGRSIRDLRTELGTLASKNGEDILR